MTSAGFDQVLHDILEAAEENPQAPSVQKANARSISSMVHQCYAVLRQELERKVKMEPHLYSEERTEHTLQEFKLAIPDIQQAILMKVEDSVSELIRQEVRHVLRDAVTDLQDAITYTNLPDPVMASEQQSSTERPIKQQISTPLPASVIEHRGMPPVDLASDQDEVIEGHHEPVDDEVYQGKVKVSVETHGNMKQTMRFLNQLSGSPQLRVLQMVSGSGGVTIWLELRRPMRLKEYFSLMPGVSNVATRPSRGNGDSEHMLDLVLSNTPQLSSVN